MVSPLAKLWLGTVTVNIPTTALYLDVVTECTEGPDKP